MRQIENYLERAGVLNRSTEDLGIIACATPARHDAFCTGVCAGSVWHPVKKDVVGKPISCPDCGWALLYRKMRGTI